MSYSIKEALKELNGESKKVNEGLFEPAILNKVKTDKFERIDLNWLRDMLIEWSAEDKPPVYLYIGYTDPNNAEYKSVKITEDNLDSVYKKIENNIKQPSGSFMVRMHSQLLHAIIDNDYLFIYVNPGEIADMYC